MRRIVLFIFVCSFMAACSKYSENKSKLEGKWQLSEMFLQTSGPGSWHVQDSIPPNFIQFNHDGSLTMSAYVSTLYNGPLSYKISNDTMMVFNYPNGGNDLYGENIMHFQLSDTVLTITPPSIEFVEEKYVRIQSN
jgi:hypothetical protein